MENFGEIEVIEVIEGIEQIEEIEGIDLRPLTFDPRPQT